MELQGSTKIDDLPTSRGEWSGFFPSIKQRKQSYSSDSSPREASEPNLDVRKTNERASSPPNTSEESKASTKKKTVRKVVKRTVSVKKTVIPADSNDRPPTSEEGVDYIKICGKWVKMKARPSTQKGASLQTSRSEWGDNLAVGTLRSTN